MGEKRVSKFVEILNGISRLFCFLKLLYDKYIKTPIVCANRFVFDVQKAFKYVRNKPTEKQNKVLENLDEWQSYCKSLDEGQEPLVAARMVEKLVRPKIRPKQLFLQANIW